jgi:hypothetical protein
MKWVALAAAAVVSAWAVNASAAAMIDDLNITFADGASFTGTVRFDPVTFNAVLLGTLGTSSQNYTFSFNDATSAYNLPGLERTFDFNAVSLPNVFFGTIDLTFPGNGQFQVVGSQYQVGIFTPVSSTSIELTPTSATPEPGVWAMLITGFGLMGFALRLRNESADILLA